MPSVNAITGRDVFRKACAYLSQTELDSTDLEGFVPDWLDTLLVEALEYENAKRDFENDPQRPQLAAAPRLQSMDEVIPFDDVICRVALPYGLASQFFIDDADDYKAQDFRARFINALMEGAKGLEESVRDVYA